MYGFSDHLKAIPLTAFRALRQGSSRYSARMGGAGSIERPFGEGVTRLTLWLPTGPRHVHAYLFEGDSGRILVDTGLGLPGDEEAWEGLAADAIVLTHIHPDHVGGAQHAAESTRAPVHQLGLDYEQCVRVWGSADWPERMAAWFRSHGVPAPVADELIVQGHAVAPFIRFVRDPQLLREGDSVDGWEVLWLPGHADGHVALLRDGVLVSGDVLLEAISPAVGLYPESRPDPLADYLRTLRRIVELVSDPPRFIAAMQLGVTLTSLGIGALGEHALTRAFDPVMATALAVVIAYLLLTFFHVVIGELVPKGVALGHSEGTALVLAAPVRAFFALFWPLIWVLQRSTNFVLGLLGLEPPGGETEVHSEAELKMLLNVSTERGEIEEGEQEMLYKVFDFADKEASDVMVPRPEVVALSIDLPPEECLKAVMESPYTRYPVYRESLDDILGILHVRDLFGALVDRGLGAVEVEQLVRPAYVVPETKDLAALLTEFRRTNQHMAIVIDEYGGVEGIVTLEDLLEEIVGEIEDEFDLPDESVEQVDEDTIRIDGTFPIDDFNEQFRTELPVEDYHTIAGFVFGQLGRAAQAGDEVAHDGMLFRVEEVEGQRIDKLAVTFEQRREESERGGQEAAG